MGEYKLKKKIDKFILDTLKERTNLLSTIIKIILYVLVIFFIFNHIVQLLFFHHSFL